ncbi:MAG: o-succinylbenzoate--CoA ligase [Simkania negevensis]|nr:o-succinylbenzoate--CoA ligase [Simkania negevensis]
MLENFSISFECPISYHARKNRENLALISSKESWTYGQCEAWVEQMTIALRSQGIKEGDKVAFLPTKEFPSPLIFFAIFRVGGVACPMSSSLPAVRIHEALDDLGATLFLVPDFLVGEFPKIKQILHPFSSLFTKGSFSFSARQTFLPKERLATHLFTSGSVQCPKIASHSLGNHYYSALGSLATIPLKQGDRYLLSLPLFHISGIAILFRTFLAGATIVIQEKEGSLLDTALKHQVSHLSFVPTQLHRLFKEPFPLQEQFTKIAKAILLGGDFISPSLFYKGKERGLPLHPTYGMTEMSSQITTYSEPLAPFSLGHTLPYAQIKIGEDQEILVKGKTLFKGYLNSSFQLEPALNAEGWFPTKDLGEYFPKQGLKVFGRKDRMFISGGEKIQPEEIEFFLGSIEGITKVHVRPHQDEEFGFRPIAYIQSEESFKEEFLREYLSTFLPKFKIPIAFYPLDQLKLGQKHSF